MSDSTIGQGNAGGSDDVVRNSYDWDEIAPAAAVLETVGQALDADPSTFDTLYDTVDPDALEALIRSVRGSGDSNARISFEYADRWVTVDSCGDVVVQTPV